MADPQLDSLLSALHDLYIYKSVQIACLVLLVYDFALTFNQEVDGIWRKKLTFLSAVSFVARYLPLVDGTLNLLAEFLPRPSPPFCKVLVYTKSWSYIVGVIIAEVVLLLRTFAIWASDKRVGLGLFTLLAVTAIASGYFAAKGLNSLDVSETSPFAIAIRPQVPGCIVVSKDTTLWAAYLCFVLFETVALLFTLPRLHVLMRNGSTPLLQTINNDGIYFYVYICAISVVAMVFLNATPAPIQPLMSSPHRALHAILAQRVLFNIQQAARAMGETNRSNDIKLSVVRFANRVPSARSGSRSRNDYSILEHPPNPEEEEVHNAEERDQLRHITW